ncbi:MAG TPA: carbohydrate-binding family 9-like protein [Clostridia bacterium]|nr:carbohydrate-binding family 9-like protein [Clostridia bacterium]
MERKPVYQIATIASGQPLTGQVFTISHDRPEGAPSPEMHGQVVYLPGEGLEVSLWCREEHPRAVYTRPNEPVHTDSCVEAFLNCFPDLPQYGYVGLEMNANGAAHCSFGTDRHNRRYVLDLGLPHPQVQIDRFTQDGAAWWRATCLLKLSLLESLYERTCDFPAGHRMRGNFYKCGDLTDAPHWGSWAPVERVDFHVPHLFGEIIVTAADK